MSSDNSTTPGFWDQRYTAGKTPWDQHGVPGNLPDFPRRTPVTGRALVPGCGSGYEIKALHDAGWPVLGLDFIPVVLASGGLGLLKHLIF